MKYIVKLKKEIEKIVVIDAETDEEADERMLKGEYEYSREHVLTNDICHGWEYVSYDTAQRVITSENDLKEYYGRDNLEKAIFNGTNCGCCYRATEEFIGITGYAEGSGDAECPEHVLYFPFTIEEWEKELHEADQEGCDLWDECHDEDGNELIDWQDKM